VRHNTIAEALRVVRPGGTVVAVDFSLPRWWHPLRYIWLPVLKRLEPFAPDLWASDASFWPEGDAREETRFFGGLYRLAKVTRAPA
jgi:ubiquinone/menaquinone biosynthesis C-methylase UbiE